HVPTLAGTLPKLPCTVETFYADGVRGRSPVVWQPVTSRQVAEGESSFTDTGLAAGMKSWEQATVYGRKSGAVSSMAITDKDDNTRVGVPLSLPETVVATFNDGSKDSSVEVTWDDVDPDRYGAPGTYTVTGRVAGTTVRAKATVTVV